MNEWLPAFGCRRRYSPLIYDMTTHNDSC
ncbi:hypothetical protein FRIGORI9N_240058 [Frigoribacterium sp. 9N]|nr:hypothetical protein FRIGORI9N_240058 [Frigoribacterium sp. 9N]